MPHVMIPFMLIPAILATSMVDAEIEYESYGAGKRFTFSISDTDLRQSPKWAEDADNPPLSARRALSIAKAMKEKLSKQTGAFTDNGDLRWELDSIQLVPWTDWKNEGISQRWYWLVRYEAHAARGGSTGIPFDLRLPILMDGRPIEPKIRPHVLE